MYKKLEYYKRSMFKEFEIFLQQGSKAASGKFKNLK